MKAIYEPKGRAGKYADLAVNLYRGCSHACEYCYVPAILRIKPDEFHKAEPRAGVLETMEREAEKYAGTDKRVLLCFTCDPYQPINGRYGLTAQAIKILRSYAIPFQVLTKAGELAFHDFGLYGPADMFGVTLTSLYKADQERFEPGASSPAERLAALIRAKEAGIKTWISLEPVLDPEKSLRIIKETREIVDLFRIGKLNHAKSIIRPQQWESFGRRAVNLCTAYGNRYYVKDDLRKYLGDFPIVNYDARRIEKKQQGRF